MIPLLGQTNQGLLFDINVKEYTHNKVLITKDNGSIVEYDLKVSPADHGQIFQLY